MLWVQQFVVHLHQETIKTTNEMKLQDLTAGSVIKYTDIENPGAEYIVLNALVGMESYINIISKETNNIEPMHKLTDINGKRWELVAKA